jgi:hypothetical protein
MNISLRNELISSFPKKVNRDNTLNIIILNTPCHGFGDVIFAVKLRKYLMEWYPFATVHIATPKVSQFMSIGENRKNLILLKGKLYEDCRRFKYLTVEKEDKERFMEYDLIFVAPLQQDYQISYQDIRSFLPYSDKYNTYFFSEYNDKISKEFDFHTGIGKGRMGMFFTDVEKKRKLSSVSKAVGLKRKEYALSYIAVTDTIPNFNQCYISFFEMVSKKYSKNSKFTIVTPKAVAEDLVLPKRKNKIGILHAYWSKIVVITPEGTVDFVNVTEKNKNKILIIRGDVFPVPNADMITLLSNSADDILLTGDQSITDALSCCPKKNIWYQIAPWKEGFVKELSKNMPQIYYKRKKTSCGTLKGIKMKSNYTNFVKNWDFFLKKYFCFRHLLLKIFVFDKMI